jgi:hypothetical protein
MTDDRKALVELVQKSGDSDFLRAVAEGVLQILMEADVEGMIGASRYERSGERATYRNGYRDRALDTRLGTLNLKIPKLRTGSYFPGFLEPRRTVEKALVSVIQEAWIAGVSTRRVDELVQAMGMSGISKSSVSKLCKDIDERVNAFLKRPLSGEWPYLWLDATYLKVREGGRIVVIHRADRLADLLALLSETAGSFSIRPIQPYADEPAKRVLVQAIKTGKAPLKLLPALVLHDRDGGKHRPEVEAILRGEAALSWG